MPWCLEHWRRDPVPSGRQEATSTPQQRVTYNQCRVYMFSFNWDSVLVSFFFGQLRERAPHPVYCTRYYEKYALIGYWNSVKASFIQISFLLCLDVEPNYRASSCHWVSAVHEWFWDISFSASYIAHASFHFSLDYLEQICIPCTVIKDIF